MKPQYWHQHFFIFVKVIIWRTQTESLKDFIVLNFEWVLQDQYWLSCERLPFEVIFRCLCGGLLGVTYANMLATTHTSVTTEACSTPHLTCRGLCGMAAWKLNRAICAMALLIYFHNGVIWRFKVALYKIWMHNFILCNHKISLFTSHMKWNSVLTNSYGIVRDAYVIICNVKSALPIP